METTTNIKGIVFARAWWAAALEALSDSERLAFYDAVMGYAFRGELAQKLPAVVNGMFCMVRPFIDQDKEKYTAMVERNRENARGNKRVAASGSQSQRVAANTKTNTNTTTNTNTMPLSNEEAEKAIEREKWYIFGYFWATGSVNVLEEVNTFWNYYESLGWKNGKGAAIVSKIACARMWRRQFETRQAPNGAFAWWTGMRSCDVPDYAVWQCYAGAERTPEKVIFRLRCSMEYWEDVKRHAPEILKALRGYAGKIPAEVVTSDPPRQD